MNLTITQDNTRTETINSSIIDKLYEIAFAASSDPNSTVSLAGNLYSAKGYANKADWLNNEFGPNLIITIASNGQYMLITDAALESVLKSSVGDGDGVFLDLLKAANPLDSVLGTDSNTDIVDTRELCLIEGTVLNGSFLNYCSNIKTLGIPCNFTYFRFARGATIENIVVKNLKNFISGDFASSYTFNRPSTGWDLYTTSDGVNITKIENLVIPSDATFSNSINQTPFLYCKSVKNVTVPYNITSLRGFYRSKIESITFEQGSVLTSILNNCFEESSNLVFDVANLPLTITTIGNNAFRSCSNVTGALDLPNLTSLGECAFLNCPITGSVSLPNLTSLGVNAFLNCSSLSGTVSLPSLTSFGLAAFKNCTGITSVNDLGSITGLPRDAFYHCSNLASIVLPSTCTSIGLYAFENDIALTNIDLSDVTIILGSGFAGCTNLSSITGTSNLTSLGSNSFANCTSLSSIDFTGSTFTSVPQSAFQNCTNLSTIKLPITVTTVNELWSRGLPGVLYITGLDNISSHPAYNWDLTDRTILNPIKTSFVTGDTFVKWSTNSLNVRIHSLYEPTRTSTRQNSQVIYGAPKNTQFVYNCLGGSGSFTIGLLYYRDITSFGNATFFRCNIENLVINNITPPTLNNSDTTFSGEGYWLNWGNSIFGNLTSSSDAVLHKHAIIGTLWVPDSAVATYQADPLYSSLTIKGINTKTNGVDYDLPRYADFAAWEAAEEAAVAQGGHAPQGLIEAWM